jgi:radical SAM protein with 4Fe4S-binding SPASM domain
MEQNAGHMRGMCDLCAGLGVSLRVNVYKAISSKKYQPGYSAFWKAVDVFFKASTAAVCSEPVINAALSEVNGSHVFKTAGSPCGTHSLRLRPGGEILPCVYWDKSHVTMQNFLSGEFGSLPDCKLPVPAICSDCPHLDICMGGCSGRRLYTGIESADIYCFRADGRSLPVLTVPRPLKGDEYIHSSYLCTMIAEFE